LYTCTCSVFAFNELNDAADDDDDDDEVRKNEGDCTGKVCDRAAGD